MTLALKCYNLGEFQCDLVLLSIDHLAQEMAIQNTFLRPRWEKRIALGERGGACLFSCSHSFKVLIFCLLNHTSSVFVAGEFVSQINI